VYSAIQYSPTAQRVLLASKENGLEIADRLIFESAQYALRYFVQEIGEGSLVPIPSRPAMVRKRGRSAISDLVAKLGEGGTRPHKTELHKNFLIHTRVVRDQSRLSSSARKLNLHGALQVIDAVKESSGNPVILIDDLVTSGATLLEASRALRAEGFVVLGAVTACVSQPLR
jgi:predicted amidophosphoribosyltransferase